MEAKDLRIGNYVNHTELGFIQVCGMNTEVIQFDYKKDPFYEEIPFDKLSYIRLTEDILLKCGFEWQDVKTHSDDRPPTKMLWKETLLVQHHDNGLWSFIIAGYPIVPPEISQYLHQLQNLYFSLTGEELEIDL